MDLLATGINAAVVAAVGLLLGYLGKERFEAMDRQLEAIERRMDRLEDRMEGFQGSLDSLRSDLTNVALAVGAKPTAEAGG